MTTYKYRTRQDVDGTIVLRTPRCYAGWPRECDAETLFVPTADRLEALRVARSEPVHVWG